MSNSLDHFAEGCALAAADDHKGAVSAFTRAIIENPSDPAPYRLRAQSRLWMQRYDLALSDLSSALQRGGSAGECIERMQEAVTYLQADLERMRIGSETAIAMAEFVAARSSDNHLVVVSTDQGPCAYVFRGDSIDEVVCKYMAHRSDAHSGTNHGRDENLDSLLSPRDRLLEALDGVRYVAIRRIIDIHSPTLHQPPDWGRMPAGDGSRILAGRRGNFMEWEDLSDGYWVLYRSSLDSNSEIYQQSENHSP